MVTADLVQILRYIVHTQHNHSRTSESLFKWSNACIMPQSISTVRLVLARYYKYGFTNLFSYKTKEMFFV
jgi:hypothetical protein